MSNRDKIIANNLALQNNQSTYSNMFSYVPTTVEITTNQTMANWLNTNFPTYTNIKIVKANWGV